MMRGDIVIVSISGDYGKPRPAVVIQSDTFVPTHATILICPITSDSERASLFRIPLRPGLETGLEKESEIMVDKIITMRREKIGRKIGTLDGGTTLQLNRFLALFLGLIS